MMFDLDETAESRNSMVSDTPRTHSHSSSSTATTGGRNLSSESTGPFGGGGGGGGADSFYSFGKALTVSMTLSDPDHKSPSRRSSHAGLPAPLPPPPALVHGSSHSSHSSVGSPNANGSSSSTAAPPSSVGGVKNPAGACSAAYAQLSLANHSEYLMWESGFCSKAGIRDSQEDRFSCHPNINDQVRCAALGVPSSSGALSGDSAGATTSSSGLGGGVEEAGGYFGVYDGHGGQAAAIYLEKYLLGNICVHPQFGKNLNQAVVESCIRTDNDFLVSITPLLCRISFTLTFPPPLFYY